MRFSVGNSGVHISVQMHDDSTFDEVKQVMAGVAVALGYSTRMAEEILESVEDVLSESTCRVCYRVTSPGEECSHCGGASCYECGKPHELVRPGKTQPTCDCESKHMGCGGCASTRCVSRAEPAPGPRPDCWIDC